MIASGLAGILAGALLWLDRVFIFQFMVSRPLIMGPLVGFIMGDVRTGIIIGASLELLWLNAPPVGSYLPNDESFCTAVAVPVAVLAASFTERTAATGLSILLCLPVSILGKHLDMHLRTLNEGLLVPRGDDISERDVSRALKKAVIRAFILAFSAVSICVAGLEAVIYAIRGVSTRSMTAPLAYVPFLCIVIGLAALVSRDMPRKSHAGLLAAGAAFVLLLSWML
jgi:mannose/fructose/N-acetylgalactosamine-specific phosphotransferase system component IIC